MCKKRVLRIVNVKIGTELEGRKMEGKWNANAECRCGLPFCGREMVWEMVSGFGNDGKGIRITHSSYGKIFGRWYADSQRMPIFREMEQRIARFMAIRAGDGARIPKIILPYPGCRDDQSSLLPFVSPQAVVVVGGG